MNTVKLVFMLNQLIYDSINHGGDPGGPYFCSPDEVKNDIVGLLEFLGLDDAYTIEPRNDDYLKIVAKR